jgi:hypothetical protein
MGFGGRVVASMGLRSVSLLWRGGEVLMRVNREVL